MFLNIFKKVNSAGVPSLTTTGGLQFLAGSRLRITGATYPLDIHPAAAGAGLKIHTHLNSTGYGSEFKGEFISTSGTMDGIAAHFHMSATGTGVLRSILGVAYLDATYTLSGTSAAASWISGVLGMATVSGVINGTAVTVTGTYGGLGACSGTLTACKYMSGIWADVSQLTKVPTTGECQAILITGPVAAVTVDSAIYVDGATYIDSFLKFDSAAGPLAADSTAMSGLTMSYKLKCMVGSTPMYLHFATA
jgi:hypothetical protein